MSMSVAWRSGSSSPAATLVSILASSPSLLISLLQLIPCKACSPPLACSSPSLLQQQQDSNDLRFICLSNFTSVQFASPSQVLARFCEGFTKGQVIWPKF